jgi:hypothetical protein
VWRRSRAAAASGVAATTSMPLGTVSVVTGAAARTEREENPP